MARTLCMGLMLDMRYIHALTDLPHGCLKSLMENLGLLLLWGCDGATPAEELQDYQTRIACCQDAIKKLRATG